jgi:hypothetical protein
MTDGTQQDPGQGGRSRLRVVLIVVIALLLAGLAVLGFFFVRMLQPPGTPKEETAGGLVWVRSIYGFGPSKDEQLLEPTSVAIAPNGDIYANDAQRSRVMRFSSDGAFKSLIHTGAGGTGPGQFKRPGSIATDADGNVFIADQSAGKIIVFDDQGSFVREWAVDGAGGLTEILCTCSPGLRYWSSAGRARSRARSVAGGRAGANWTPTRGSWSMGRGYTSRTR